MTYIFTRNYF